MAATAHWICIAIRTRTTNPALPRNPNHNPCYNRCLDHVALMFVYVCKKMEIFANTQDEIRGKKRN